MGPTHFPIIISEFFPSWHTKERIVYVIIEIDDEKGQPYKWNNFCISCRTALDAIGLEPVDHAHPMSRCHGGSGHHRPSSALPPSRQVLLAAW